MRTRDAVIGWLAYAVSFPKILILKLRGVSVGLTSGVRIFGWPKVTMPRLVTIGQRVTIGRFVRMEGRVTLADDVFINEFTTLAASTEAPIEIGPQSSLAPGCFLITGDHDIKSGAAINVAGKDEGGAQGPISIGKNAWLGARVIVLKNVKIGDGAVIGAGSVVTKDVASRSVAVGNPAKAIKQRV